SMHFKTCRKASSSDDCERITGKPEVIGLSTGLVPRKALLATNPFLTRSRLVGTNACENLRIVTGSLGNSHAAVRRDLVRAYRRWTNSLTSWLISWALSCWVQ